MRMKSIMWVAGLLLIPAPALADEEKAKPAEAPAAAKLICKKQSEVGSLVRKKRVCKTAEEWERIADASRDSMTQGQMSGGSNGN